MTERFHVLIVEDDFRVAEITRQFVEKVPEFEVVATLQTGEATKAYLASGKAKPDLILLDVFIPDVEGLELFWEIRRLRQCDVIMMTAAKEVKTIEETLRGGVFDYIIKPVEFARLEKTLERYRHQRRTFMTNEELEQEEIDGLFAGRQKRLEQEADYSELPKGIDRLTLEKVRRVMKDDKEEGLTAAAVGKTIGASRSTARRYLEYLVTTNEIAAEQKYGEVGRPERRYFRLQDKDG
ncbi:response regulator [Alkalihalobacillus oceani]|uniref:Response regulator n=1 Tax=Halalkalibacter oceani TaxID=1653776 RepID=A0A9X2IPQ7_9BACI|nr:response regulator [Halalkalibacter oceani]MCM3715505.1 response regulator [Halalkalibacter oceani]